MNRIAVMSDGRVAEFDTPTRLLDDPSTMFCGMASNMGQEQLTRLKELASSSRQVADDSVIQLTV
jgi:ABC-type proline/glycine betaine transport system ATPase subunit